jgi:hypothetical protein
MKFLKIVLTAQIDWSVSPPDMNAYSPSKRSTRPLSLCVLAFACLINAPFANAGQADGSYRIQRISSSKSFPVPAELIAKSLATNNRITIRDNQITVQPKKWLDILNHFNFLFYGGTAKISGPKTIQLEPSGDSFTGKTARPVNINLTGDFLGLPIQMNLRATGRGTVVGDQLVLTLPTRVSTDGETTSAGTIRVVARR